MFSELKAVRPSKSQSLEVSDKVVCKDVLFLFYILINSLIQQIYPYFACDIKPHIKLELSTDYDINEDDLNT